MKPRTIRYILILLSAIIIVGGESTLWFLFPFVLDRLGGINLLTLSLSMIFSSVFVLVGIHILRYALGKPIRRWQMDVTSAYVGLAMLIGLGFVYDSLLPDSILFIWPYAILPLMTMTIAFYLLRRIPKIREKIDKLFKDY